MRKLNSNLTSAEALATDTNGFTLIEVLIAASIMIILCVGTLTVFSHAVRINAGNNLRAQAQSVLQLEAEYYRSLKFVPVGSDGALAAGSYPGIRTRQSADNQSFRISVVIENIPAGDEASTVFKQIRITAEPTVARTGWLADLQTDLTIQRVRAN